MNCQDFRTELDHLDDMAVPAPMAEHAKECPACQGLLRAERQVGAALTVLDRATPRVDLRSPIMAAIEREAAAREPSASLLDRLLHWLSPAGLSRRTLAFGLGLVLLALLSYEAVWRPTVSRPEPAWEMALLAVDAARVPADWASRRTGIALPRGQPVDLGAGSRASLNLPGRSRVEMTDGSFTPLASGFRMTAGRADVQVEKTSSTTPFSIETPFAAVAVIGTRFSLDLTSTALHVAVAEGRVRVVHATGLREVGPGEALSVGASGFLLPASAPVALGLASAPSPVPEAHAGSSSSPLEEDNPGR